MTRYDVIYEQADDGSWSVRAAELPVFTVGDTREEAEREIREAIAFYLDELSRSGGELPAPIEAVGTVEV